MSADIVPFKARRYEAIPITKIKVINSRNRDQEQFEMNLVIFTVSWNYLQIRALCA